MEVDSVAGVPSWGVCVCCLGRRARWVVILVIAVRQIEMVPKTTTPLLCATAVNTAQLCAIEPVWSSEQSKQSEEMPF